MPLGGLEGERMVLMRWRRDRSMAEKLKACRNQPVIGEAGCRV